MWSFDGWVNESTTNFSKALAMIGVNEIGRKSEQTVGALTLGTGVIIAVFHCVGT